MLIGYARVSTLEQDVNPQIDEFDELQRAGCTKIFRDKISGVKAERPGLDQALKYLCEGDSLLVWRLDRLGRSLKHLIETVSWLEERDIGFRSLQEAIDTKTSSGRLIFHIFGALAEFERNLIRERTMAGLRTARARGRVGGRPRTLGDKKPEPVFGWHQQLIRRKWTHERKRKCGFYVLSPSSAGKWSPYTCPWRYQHTGRTAC